jgi:hypothetical protein
MCSREGLRRIFWAQDIWTGDEKRGCRIHPAAGSGGYEILSKWFVRLWVYPPIKLSQMQVANQTTFSSLVLVFTVLALIHRLRQMGSLMWSTFPAYKLEALQLSPI